MKARKDRYEVDLSRLQVTYFIDGRSRIVQYDTLSQMEAELDWFDNRLRRPYPRWKLALDLAVIVAALVVTWAILFY